VIKWIWLAREVVIAIHEVQLAEHGGRAGIRDLGLLDSALARPLNITVYGESDHASLAAAYGYGIARNHPFIDGNKRTAFVAMELFLALNRYVLTAEDTLCVTTMLEVASGTMEEEGLAQWIRTHSKRA
jgi:death on curing protein